MWRERPVRIAFAGCGMVSEMHAEALRSVPAAELVAVHDADRELARRRAAAWGCRAHDELGALLADPDVEAVLVLTPTRTHVEIASAALDAGKHVLVEKPVSTDLKGLRRLQARASAARLVCMPGHNYAYVPEIARIGRLVREGRLGRIRLLSVVFAIAHDEAVAARHDGALRVVMPHHAYLAHGLLGTPARVHAGVTEPAWESLQREDQCWMTLEYPPHATALLFCSMAVDDDSADPWTFVVKVLGSEGSASATWRAGVWKSAVGTLSTGYAPYSEAYERELEAFCRAVRGDESAILSPLEHAVGAERILAAAERAIAHGAPTSLST
jgi:predicted dehydrogenase